MTRNRTHQSNKARLRHRQRKWIRYQISNVQKKPLAVEEWNRIVGELTVLGILSRFDRGPLAIYCGAYAAWAEAFEAMQKYGMMIKSPTGYPVQSPYMAIMNRQAEIMLRIAGEFGFTPASRARNFSYSKSQSMLLLEPEPQPSPKLPPLDLGR